MPRGYIDGPASEEAERLADQAASGAHTAAPSELRPAVYGSTDEQPEPHFLGWHDELDPAELFAAGKAWGLTVRRVAAA